MTATPDAVRIQAPSREFLVACLCAQWCDTCRDYRPGFQALAACFPQADFVWLDIEDEAQWIGEYDVEDFPTLLIQRGRWVLFYGTMLPHVGHLERTLTAFADQPPEESRAYALGNQDRQGWQERYDLRTALGS